MIKKFFSSLFGGRSKERKTSAVDEVMLFEEARKLEESGNLDGAIKIMDTLVHQLRERNVPSPQLAFALAGYGELLIKDNQPEKGFPLLKEAFQIATKHNITNLAKRIESRFPNISKQ